MKRPFDDTTRRNIAGLCAAFARVQGEEAAPGLKRAAVAIALTGADDADETALLLTRRASGLRSHRAQWALPGGRCASFAKRSGLRSVRTRCSACSTIIRPAPVI